MKAVAALPASLRSDLGLALFWSLAAALGTVAVLPYLFALLPTLTAKVKLPFALFATVQSLQIALLVFILGLLGLRCRALTGLDSPIVRAWLNGEALPSDFPGKIGAAAFLGFVIGIALLFSDRGFSGLMPAPYSPLPRIMLWKRLLASLYGGVTEECLVRLFLMSGIVWLLLKVLPSRSPADCVWIYWLGIALAALLFGIGHLPAARAIWPLTAVVVSRTVVLNAFGGIFFGWLFWRWGFEYAVIAHFSTDLIVHGFGSS